MREVEQINTDTEGGSNKIGKITVTLDDRQLQNRQIAQSIASEIRKHRISALFQKIYQHLLAQLQIIATTSDLLISLTDPDDNVVETRAAMHTMGGLKARDVLKASVADTLISKH